MKLTDLAPAWHGVYDSGPNAIASFLCPVCRKHRIDIPITPTRDSAPLYGPVQWQRTGDDFTALTLSPSIAHDSGAGCKSHFFVREGEIVFA